MVRVIGLGRFGDDIADAIANPDPSRPMRNAAGNAGRALCDAFSNVPDWARNAPGYTKGLANACKPYWDKNGISPPSVAPPFTGGQCPGVPYTVNGTYRVACPPNTQNSIANWRVTGVLGPINGIGRVGQGWVVQHGTGQTSPCVSLITSSQIVNAPAGLSCGQLTSPFNGADNVKIVSVTRQTAGADDCGNPPPVLTPGPNPSPSNPVIPPELQPYEDPVEGPVIPIPDLPTLPGLPDIPFRNPFADEPLSDPTSPGVPGTPVDTGPGVGGGGGGTAEEDAPPNSELVAIKINFTQPPPARNEVSPGVYRGVAYAYLGNDDGLDLDPIGATMRDGQIAFAEARGLTKFRVSANVGFYLRVTPYYKQLEPQQV